MKKRNNRFLAGTLAGLMMLTMLPVTALAAQEGADGDAASDTSNSIVNVVSDGKNVQQAENNNLMLRETAAPIMHRNPLTTAAVTPRMHRNPLTTATAAMPIQPHLLCRRAKTAARAAAVSRLRLRLRRKSRLLRRLVLRRMKLWMQLLKLYRVTKLLRLAKIAR